MVLDSVQWTPILVSIGHQFWSLEIYFVSQEKKQGMIFEILKILILKNLNFLIIWTTRKLNPLML